MTRLGIITNYQAGRNRKRPERIRTLVRDSGALALDVTDLDSIRAATRQLAEEGVDILAINGGDGTVHAVLTRLMRRSARLPLIAVVPGGTTNLSANDLSRAKSPEMALENLFRIASLPDEQLPLVQRRLLEVVIGDSLPQFGLFLGAGAVLRGMEHFRDNVGARGFRGELAAGFSMIRGIVGIARGKAAWTGTHLADVRPVARDNWHEGRMLVIATTMNRLILGTQPWWGKQSEPIRLTVLRHGPDSLLRLTPSLLKGKPHRLMTPAHGYRSDNVSGFELRSTTGFALDGELFPLAANEIARISSTEPIDFLDIGRQ
jgi:hypothetical protein